MDQPPFKTGRICCVRCGECCLGSSPTLHKEDVSLVGKGPLRRSDLYTIRAGELVRDNVRGRLETAREEIIKVRERPERGGCIFYSGPDRGCAIYEQRPSQCRALKCWDDTEFLQVYGGPRAARREIIDDENLLRVISEHEKRCSYSLLESYVRRIRREGEGPVRKILEILRFDHRIRLLIPQKLPVDPDEINLILGRPLTETISMFGLKVVNEPDGSFLLTVL